MGLAPRLFQSGMTMFRGPRIARISSSARQGREESSRGGTQSGRQAELRPEARARSIPPSVALSLVRVVCGRTPVDYFKALICRRLLLPFHLVCCSSGHRWDQVVHSYTQLLVVIVCATFLGAARVTGARGRRTRTISLRRETERSPGWCATEGRLGMVDSYRRGVGLAAAQTARCRPQAL